jgi:hypothetical protein
MTVEHITRDGTAMLISDMDDGHLLNTIKWIERRAKEGFYVKCGFSYGDSHEDYYYDEPYYQGEEALKHLNYSSYVEEAYKRGLTNVF